jgi:hypothetical protein
LYSVCGARKRILDAEAKACKYPLAGNPAKVHLPLFFFGACISTLFPCTNNVLQFEKRQTLIQSFGPP